MPTTILSSALSKPSLSIVGNDGSNIAANLKISRVGIKLSSRVMRHMLEAGNSIVDARIVQPTKIQIDVFVATFDDLTLVNGLLLDRTQTYTVTSRGLVFTSVMAEGEAIRQSAEVISANPVRISLKQLLQAGNQKAQVEQSADTSLFDQGITELNSAAISVQDLVSSLASTSAATIKQVVNGALVDASGNTFILDSSELA